MEIKIINGQEKISELMLSNLSFSNCIARLLIPRNRCAKLYIGLARGNDDDEHFKDFDFAFVDENDNRISNGGIVFNKINQEYNIHT